MNHLEIIRSKIVDQRKLDSILAGWRMKSDKIIFTNGCFDLLHGGHIHLLSSAKDFGTRLIVGLNSDASVKRLKGDQRPIQNENDRAIIMSSQHLVDAVILFEEDTPLNLIQFIKPDILVKGGDWEISKIVGADFVKSHGGEVKTIPYLEGNSTSLLEEKLKKL